jgi:hypothetical protein
MNVPIFALSRRVNAARPRRNRCIIGVESMEGRALLSSAAVSSAVSSVQQAESSALNQISQEISTLKSNIVTIEQSTTAFISSLSPGDQTETKNAIRDEKFAIGQQNFLIGALNQLEKQTKSTLGSIINALNKGRLDPATVPDILSTASDNLQAEIGTIDSTATFELSGLTGTFATGNT